MCSGGVALGAGEAVKEDDLRVKEVECEGGFEMRREKEKGIWRIASFGNRLDQSLSFQIVGMHVQNALFVVGHQSDCCVVRPVGNSISAGPGMVTTAGWQASVEPRVEGADGHGVGVGGLGDHREGRGVVGG